MKKLLIFTTILFSILSVSPLLAHLFEMRSKMQLDREVYLLVQGLYSGWAWLGIFEIGCLLFTLWWAFLDRSSKPHSIYLWIAGILFLLSLGLFFMFTFPANQETQNWTILPTNWTQLRKNWEYSHAVRAGMNLVGFCFLIATLITRRR